MIRIGTRGSELALWQTDWVKEILRKQYPQMTFENKIIKTTGDKILDVPLAKIGDKGLFTKELDLAILQKQIDLAVHSLKDIPTELPQGIVIGAITERGDVRDALISRHHLKLSQLPSKAVIATGSLRRSCQLRYYRADFQIANIRGNLNTRFRKFDEADWDAMILAVAGIERLGCSERISEKISPNLLLPAVGQGSFGVVCREEDQDILSLLSSINHRPSAIAAKAERAMLKALGGGCQIPIGAFAHLERDALKMKGCICSIDGKEKVDASITGSIDQPEELGRALAKQLLDSGGKRFHDISAVKQK